MYKRFGFSGIYVYEQFPTDKRGKPTCIEDCLLDTRMEFLESLEGPELHRTLDTLFDGYKNMAKHLSRVELVKVANSLAERLHRYGKEFGFKDITERE